jgi:uncharacterized cupin superfamily protein
MGRLDRIPQPVREDQSMAGGIDVRKPTAEEVAAMTKWPTWSCEVSTFDWQYDDKETCYILEGQVTVKTSDGAVSFGPGDRVVFPQGLQCVWQVSAPVRKHYQFG